jgi:hypothetical protein
MATNKYKTSSHLVGAKGQPIASGSIATAEELGDADTVKRYTDLGAIAPATKEDIEAAAAAPAVGGSIVEETPAKAEDVADEAADKSPSAKNK